MLSISQTPFIELTLLFSTFISAGNRPNPFTLNLCYVKQAASFLGSLAHLPHLLWLTQLPDSGKYMVNMRKYVENMR